MYCPKCTSNEIMTKAGRADSSKKRRYRCKSCGHRTTTPKKHPNLEIEGTIFKKANKKARRFIITAIQNNSEVFMPFYESLMQDREINGTEIIAIPMQYMNVEKDTKIWWDSVARDITCNERFDIGKYLTVFGDINILATAATPLSGFDSITLGKSGIFGHTKRHLKCIPTNFNKDPVIITTTGCLSKSNYIQKKAGQKAEFHHVIGGVVVEVLQDGRFHLRQITAASDGSYYDLDRHYTRDGVFQAGRALGVVFGDIHHAKKDDNVWDSYWNMLHNKLRPKKAVLHDVLDASSFNPHESHNPFYNINNSVKSVEEEVNNAIKFINDISSKFNEVAVADSNHDDMLDRWIKNSDWKQLGINAEFYLRLAHKLLTNNDSAFRLLCSEHDMKKVKMLSPYDSYKLGRFECKHHGHVGANGARGNTFAFSKAGTKIIHGHTHTDTIYNGAWSPGTMSKLDHGYNIHGLSSWTQSLVVVYPDGHASLIRYIDGIGFI